MLHSPPRDCCPLSHKHASFACRTCSLSLHKLLISFLSCSWCTWGPMGSFFLVKRLLRVRIGYLASTSPTYGVGTGRGQVLLILPFVRGKLKTPGSHQFWHPVRFTGPVPSWSPMTTHWERFSAAHFCFPNYAYFSRTVSVCSWSFSQPASCS